MGTPALQTSAAGRTTRSPVGILPAEATLVQRCRHCGALVEEAPPITAPSEPPPPACPECAPTAHRELGLRARRVPARTARTTCPSCRRPGVLRPLSASEQRAYEACTQEGHPGAVCARTVIVRYGLES